MIDLLRRLTELEADVRYQEFAKEGDRGFAYVPSGIPVLLSAPHGAVHTRLGNLKQEDEYTTGFARLIAEKTNAHLIYTRRKLDTDPNWNPDVPYKRLLRQVIEKEAIRFVLDIHGCAEHRDFGIALGTMNGESCPQRREVIIRVFEAHGFFQNAENPHCRFDVDRRFTAVGLEGQETITRFVWESLGVPAAQFEIHPSLRIVERRSDATEPQPFHGVPEMIEAVTQAFIDLVHVLSDPMAV
ncbi:MAG: hypothetical protein KAS19_12070 [Anaerolineales bacterium]|nr:hypothetical protein [Anaerolineales bacterium]